MSIKPKETSVTEDFSIEGEFYAFPGKIKQCVGHETIWGRNFDNSPIPIGRKPVYNEIDVPGMTLRSYAAIHLGVPDSGIEWPTKNLC